MRREPPTCSRCRFPRSCRDHHVDGDGHGVRRIGRTGNHHVRGWRRARISLHRDRRRKPSRSLSARPSRSTSSPNSAVTKPLASAPESGCLGIQMVDDAALRAERERRIIEVLLSLNEGEVTTYGDVADVAGYPKMSRLVGRIVGHHRRRRSMVARCQRLGSFEGERSPASGRNPCRGGRDRAQFTRGRCPARPFRPSPLTEM